MINRYMVPNGRRPATAAPPGFFAGTGFAETHAAPPGFRQDFEVATQYRPGPGGPPGRPDINWGWGTVPVTVPNFWGTPVPRGRGILDGMNPRIAVGPIEPMSTLEETRNTVGLSRVMLCHGGDSGDWFQVPPNTEIILFTKNGQTLYLPQLKGILKWIRDTSEVLPNKNMESLDGKQYHIEEAFGSENIKLKVSINSANLVQNTGPFAPIATNSDTSKALRGLPGGSLCPDLIISARNEEEMCENRDGSSWGTGPVRYPSGFVGIYYPNEVNITDDPYRRIEAIAIAGIEKETTRGFRLACSSAPAIGSPYNGGRLSVILPMIRKYYVDNGLLQDGHIFRLFIPACSSPLAPPQIHRTPSISRGVSGILGNTHSTRALAVGGVKRRKNYTRRIKKYRKKPLHKKRSTK